MIKIRPIDEELNSLHEPVAFTVSEDDNDSALDGFRVTNSGSVMIPSGLTKPYIQRATSAATGSSVSGNTHAPHQNHQDPYQLQNYQQQQDYLHYQYYQQVMQMQIQQQQFQQAFYSNSLPRSFSRYQAGYSRTAPVSLPASLPQYFSHQTTGNAPVPHSFPAMSPMGMSPMAAGHSPMAHHNHQLQQQYISQAYNYTQYPYPSQAW